MQFLSCFKSATQSMSAIYTADQVKEHNTSTSAWIIIDGYVYDITTFAAMHPGGELLILSFAGKDATETFYSLHRHEVIVKFQGMCIGQVKQSGVGG